MNFTGFNECITFLYAQLPMFQNQGKKAYKPGLDRVIQLCETLNNPHKKIKTIHLAGTNGKGSCSHMLASILQEQGLKVGLYTSPHLVHFNERIKINGQAISEAKILEFVNKIRPSIEQIKPSFFEITAAMAFYYFEQEKVDVAIIETGLGGRLDSTNIITPILSIITNISYDHTDILGNTLTKIAIEKAGIIKPGIPVCIGEYTSETKPVFIKKAAERNAEITFCKPNIHHKFECDLKGSYQQKNINTVTTAVKILTEKSFKISSDTIKKGLSNVIKNTGLQGRWQILQNKPKVICDTAHNESGVNFTMNQLLTTPHENLHIVWGMVSDKDSSKILQLLPKNAIYYFCKPNVPRGKNAESLYTEAKNYSLQGNKHSSVKHAIEQALLNSKPKDVIYIGGSTFIVADALSSKLF